jgi:O-antigen/teichoic acid export membrane protein
VNPSDPKDIGRHVNRAMAWVGTASSMVGVLDIVALVLLLRFWISEADYGIATLAITLFPVLDIAAELGLTAAVIQRDDHTPERISTVFWLNLIMSVIFLALLAFAIGPALSWLHGQAVVGLMLTAYGGKLIFNNVYAIPSALMRRELRFKELSVIRMIANIGEFCGKVGFAAAGFGIWALVLGPFCRVLITGIGVQICHPWRPRFVLRIREAYDWAAFGIKTSFSQILFHVYTNLDYQVVGYFFGPAANGLYKLAYDIVLEPVKMIAEAFITAAFPAYSRLKHHKDKLADQLVAFTRMNLVVMLGILSVVFVSTEDLLEFFWGPEWVPAATAIRILCIVGVLRAQSYLMPPLLDGIGRPGLTLTYTGLSALLLPTLFVIGAATLGDELGYLSVAIAWAVGYPVAFAVLAYMVLNIIDFKSVDYLRRVAGIPLCTGLAMIPAALTRWGLGEAPVAIRFTATASVMVVAFFVLLAYLQGISPRAIKRAVKGDVDSVPTSESSERSA